MTRTAIITGGAGGMGLATAKILGTDHRVIVVDVDQARVEAAVEELHTLGFNASGTVCDITNRAAVERMLDTAGRIDAVIHTAGVSPQMGSASRIVNINATGTVNIAQGFLAHAREGNVLVHVASTAGYALPRVLIPTRAFRLAETDPGKFERKIVRRARVAGSKLASGLAYAISKAFVIWYTRELAVPFGERGARVVSVSPGSFDTAMGRLEEDHGATEFMKVAAIKRFGKPEEIAAVLAFCASQAPGYLTGTDILVDGGTRAGRQHARRR